MNYILKRFPQRDRGARPGIPWNQWAEGWEFLTLREDSPKKHDHSYGLMQLTLFEADAFGSNNPLIVNSQRLRGKTLKQLIIDYEANIYIGAKKIKHMFDTVPDGFPGINNKNTSNLTYHEVVTFYN